MSDHLAVVLRGVTLIANRFLIEAFCQAVDPPAADRFTNEVFVWPWLHTGVRSVKDQPHSPARPEVYTRAGCRGSTPISLRSLRASCEHHDCTTKVVATKPQTCLRRPEVADLENVVGGKRSKCFEAGRGRKAGSGPDWHPLPTGQVGGRSSVAESRRVRFQPTITASSAGWCRWRGCC